MNGVFLVALCLSIFLEAIQRFVEPQEVSNPRLVLIVGCLGLLSNILGLFLFHEHGHSHGGGHGHSHGEPDKLATAEEGHSHEAPLGADAHTNAVADESGNVADVLPESTIGGWPKTKRATGVLRGSQRQRKGSQSFSRSDEDGSTAIDPASPLSTKRSATFNSNKRHRRHTSASRSRFASADNIPLHPASFRNDIIAASRLEDIESGTGSESEAVEDDDQAPTEGSPLLGHAKNDGSTKYSGTASHSHVDNEVSRHDSWHVDHNHNKPKEESKDGHSHADLNMRGVFLHVMGDALGNIGVIGSALFIWLSKFSWRFYSDPVISLVITLIILGSAIPLCQAASRILLQAVPAGISVDEIKEDIEELPGILSCHHVHVWQLSDTKLVASLHVQLEYDFKGEGSARYMQLARAIRRCMHEYGIHSSTIQPEFCLDSNHRHVSENETSDPDTKKVSKRGSKVGSLRSEAETCLLDCGDECDEGGQCCAPSSIEADTHDESNHPH